MFSKLVPPALRKGRHPGRRWHVGGGVLLAVAAGVVAARWRSRRSLQAVPHQGVLDLTATGAAEDALEESTQTPIPVA